MTRIILDSNVWAIYAYGDKLDRLANLSDREDIILFTSGKMLKEVFSTCSKPIFLDRGVNPEKVIKVMELISQLVTYKSLF